MGTMVYSLVCNNFLHIFYLNNPKYWYFHNKKLIQNDFVEYNCKAFIVLSQSDSNPSSATY